MARLEEINALSERSPGFVWRLQTEDRDATAARAYPGDDRIMINMSVWADLESLRAFSVSMPSAQAINVVVAGPRLSRSPFAS